MNTETWQQRQKKWQLFLVENNIQQKVFAEKHGFDPAQLSVWFNGKQLASGNNETRISLAIFKEKQEIETTLKCVRRLAGFKENIDG